jgi:hypothetical protein
LSDLYAWPAWRRACRPADANVNRTDLNLAERLRQTGSRWAAARQSWARDPAQFSNSTVGPFRRGAKVRSRSVAMAPVEALAMLQVLAYELDECLLRVAVEQISGSSRCAQPPNRADAVLRARHALRRGARAPCPSPASWSVPRSTGTFGADALAAAPPPQWPLRVNLGSDRRTGSLGRVR